MGKGHRAAAEEVARGIEQLERPKDPAPRPERAAPAPPPEPRQVEPPVEIASFLAEAAQAPGPWHVTINELAGDELANRAPKGRFLGYRVTRRRAVPQPLADDLVRRLALATSYVDGDVGCDGLPVGIAVARGSVAINFVEDCHHVYLTERGHEGRWALFSPQMATFLDALK